MATKSFAIATQGTLDEVHRRFVATARSEHSKVMRAEPRPTHFERYVDGKRGLPETSARPNGVITYLYPRLTIVVQYAMEMLFQFSPVLSGDYRNAHTIFLNGRAVTDLLGWRSGDEVVISNFMPYARKIDLGVMKMRIAGTSRVYEQAVSATNRKYKSIARALHTYRAGAAGAMIAPTATVKQSTIVRGIKGRFATGTRTVRISGGEHNLSQLRYPAILFKEV